MSSPRLSWWIVLLLFGALDVGSADAAPPTFEREVLPILSAKCIICHGEGEPEAKLDLIRQNQAAGAPSGWRKAGATLRKVGPGPRELAAKSPRIERGLAACISVIPPDRARKKSFPRAIFSAKCGRKAATAAWRDGCRRSGRKTYSPSSAAMNGPGPPGW